MARIRAARLAAAPRAGLALLLAVYALVYARALGHGFVWDDLSNVVESAPFEAPLGLALRATQHDFLDPTLLDGAGLPVPYESYRPLLFASYALDDALFGRSPLAMHAHGVLLGALCACAAWWFFALALGDRRLALGAAALFALHPIQVELVCYVSARGDLLCTLLALLAGAACLRAGAASGARARAGWSLAGAAAFAASLSAKEASAALPVALALWALALRRLRAARAPLAALGGALALSAGLRLAAVGAARSHVDAGNAWQGLASLPRLALAYLRIYAIPNDLSIERLAPGADGAVISWVALLALLAAGALARAGRLGGASPAAARAVAGLAGFAALLAPASLATASFGVAADRYASLPSAWLCLALFGAAPRLAREPRARARLLAAAAAWGAVLLGVTAAQVSVWRDPESLYGNSLRVAPESPMSHYRMGVLRARQGAWQEALAHFEAALARDPDHVRALNNAGVAYLNLGRLAEAESVLARALARSGERNFRAWNNLATLRIAQQRSEAACEALRRSLAINPEYAVARGNLARHCGREESGG
jgi:tetratricopeptide (TPR) repeat protein